MPPKALNFDIIRECSTSKARAGLLTLPHGNVETPVFMPVGKFHSLFKIYLALQLHRQH